MNTRNNPLLPLMLGLLWAISVGSGCNQNKESTNKADPGVELIQATKQDWTAGIAGGGSGTEFTFIVRTPATGSVTFRTIALGGAELEPAIVRPGGPVSNEPVQPAAGDTLHLRLSLKREEAAAKATSATIHYLLNDAEQQLAVPSIDKLPALPRP